MLQCKKTIRESEFALELAHSFKKRIEHLSRADSLLGAWSASLLLSNFSNTMLISVDHYN